MFTLPVRAERLQWKWPLSSFSTRRICSHEQIESSGGKWALPVNRNIFGILQINCRLQVYNQKDSKFLKEFLLLKFIETNICQCHHSNPKMCGIGLVCSLITWKSFESLRVKSSLGHLRQTEDRLLGFSYDFGVTVICDQNVDAMPVLASAL
jgi:hypothetical protein